MSIRMQGDREIFGVIFDVDGTLLDSMPIWDVAGERYLNKLQIQAEENLGKRLFAMTMTEGALYLKETYKLENSIDDIIDGINQVVYDFYLNEVQAKEGVVTFLQLLKENNIKITIATSSDRPLIEGALNRLKLMQYIDAIYTCSEVGIGKDKPDIYYEACKSMNTQITQTCVFEDALHALITAQNAGFITVGIYDLVSEDNQDKIKEIAEYYITDFTQISTILQQD